VIAFALAVLTAAGSCTPERVASVRVVEGMPFVQPLRPDVRVTRRRRADGSVYLVTAASRTAAEIVFVPAGITVQGTVASRDAHRIDVYVAPPSCPPPPRANLRFDAQTGLVAS
jgi:hypothetical protein